MFGVAVPARSQEIARGGGIQEEVEGVRVVRKLERSAFPSGFAVGVGLNDQQKIAGGDLLTRAHRNRLDDPRDRRLKADLHFHRLEKTELLARFHTVAHRDLQPDHHGWSAGAHLSGELAAKAVGVALDLDAQPRLGHIV